MRLAVLVSGSGTNLQALLDAGLPVELVVSDRPAVGALDRAERAGVAATVIDRAKYLPDRDAFTRSVADALVRAEIELVAMAGFMTILSQPIFDHFEGRIINVHPSLLPAFPGAHAVRDALDFGVKVTGCTVHVAVPTVDAGPILAQEAVPIFDDDDEASLHARIQIVEHRLYPQVLHTLLQKGVR